MAEAAQTLQELSGQTHKVFTAFCLIGEDGGKKIEIVSSEVSFRKLSKLEIDSDVMTKESLDKAGSYGLQGAGAALIKSVNGSITNVIGLPIDEVLSCAKEIIS